MNVTLCNVMYTMSYRYVQCHVQWSSALACEPVAFKEPGLSNMDVIHDVDIVRTRVSLRVRGIFLLTSTSTHNYKLKLISLYNMHLATLCSRTGAVVQSY